MAATKQGRVKRSEIDWQSSVPKDVLERIVKGIESGVSRQVLAQALLKDKVPPPTFAKTWKGADIGDIYIHVKGFKSMSEARKKFALKERVHTGHAKAPAPAPAAAKPDESESAAVTPGSVVVREGKQPEAEKPKEQQGKDLAGPAKPNPKPERSRKRGKATAAAAK